MCCCCRAERRSARFTKACRHAQRNRLAFSSGVFRRNRGGQRGPNAARAATCPSSVCRASQRVHTCTRIARSRSISFPAKRAAVLRHAGARGARPSAARAVNHTARAGGAACAAQAVSFGAVAHCWRRWVNGSWCLPASLSRPGPQAAAPGGQPQSRILARLSPRPTLPAARSARTRAASKPASTVPTRSRCAARWRVLRVLELSCSRAAGGDSQAAALVG